MDPSGFAAGDESDEEPRWVFVDPNFNTRGRALPRQHQPVPQQVATPVTATVISQPPSVVGEAPQGNTHRGPYGACTTYGGCTLTGDRPLTPGEWVLLGTAAAGPLVVTPLVEAWVAAAASGTLAGAGFASAGTPLIIDSNLASNAVVSGLRAQGFNVRTVAEIFGRDVGDPAIRALAERIGARVVTMDRGRQLGQGFGQLAIQIDARIANSAASIARYLRSLGVGGG